MSGINSQSFIPGGQDALNHDHGEHGNFEFTSVNISKELIAAATSNNLMNHSLYSGGSSLIGLNYALGQVPPSGKPQEMIMLKVQDREIFIPKIDIERVL